MIVKPVIQLWYRCVFLCGGPEGDGGFISSDVELGRGEVRKSDLVCNKTPRARPTLATYVHTQHTHPQVSPESVEIFFVAMNPPTRVLSAPRCSQRGSYKNGSDLKFLGFFLHMRSHTCTPRVVLAVRLSNSRAVGVYEASVALLFVTADSSETWDRRG